MAVAAGEMAVTEMAVAEKVEVETVIHSNCNLQMNYLNATQ